MKTVTVVVSRNSTLDVRDVHSILRNRSAEFIPLVLEEGEHAPSNSIVVIDLPDGIRKPNRHVRFNTPDLRRTAPEWAIADGTTIVVGIRKNYQMEETFDLAILGLADQLGIPFCHRECDKTTPGNSRYTSVDRQYAIKLAHYGPQEI